MIPPTPWAHVASHLTSRYPLTVRFCETDLMGIVHHDLAPKRLPADIAEVFRSAEHEVG